MFPSLFTNQKRGDFFILPAYWWYFGIFCAIYRSQTMSGVSMLTSHCPSSFVESANCRASPRTNLTPHHTRRPYSLVSCGTLYTHMSVTTEWFLVWLESGNIYGAFVTAILIIVLYFFSERISCGLNTGIYRRVSAWQFLLKFFILIFCKMISCVEWIIQ